MKRFHVECVIETPSDWNYQKARAFVVERMLTSALEKTSLQVVEMEFEENVFRCPICCMPEKAQHQPYCHHKGVVG